VSAHIISRPAAKTACAGAMVHVSRGADKRARAIGV
jgi:hypothetical protein